MSGARNVECERQLFGDTPCDPRLVSILFDRRNRRLIVSHTCLCSGSRCRHLIQRIQNSEFAVKLAGHESQPTWVAFSPDGQLLASGDSRGIVKLWNVAQAKEVATLKPDIRLAPGMINLDRLDQLQFTSSCLRQGRSLSVISVTSCSFQSQSEKGSYS